MEPNLSCAPSPALWSGANIIVPPLPVVQDEAGVLVQDEAGQQLQPE